MKKFWSEFFRITVAVLLVPVSLFCLFDLGLEIMGYPKMDELLMSLQIPFTAKQITNVEVVLFLIWLPCFFGNLWFQKEAARKSAEEDAERRAALFIDPDRTDEPLRPAGTSVKSRILLEHRVGVYHICYRRVKKTNELVINGLVYDEMTARVEPSHELRAMVEGHDIRVGFNSVGFSYASFDGKRVAKKVRLF